MAIERAASAGKEITYSALLHEMESGATANSRYLTEILCEISAASLAKEQIFLSTVVVNAGGAWKGIPGSGFFDFARSRGFEFDNERTFWLREVRKVYAAHDS